MCRVTTWFTTFFLLQFCKPDSKNERDGLNEWFLLTSSCDFLFCFRFYLDLVISRSTTGAWTHSSHWIASRISLISPCSVLLACSVLKHCFFGISLRSFTTTACSVLTYSNGEPVVLYSAWFNCYCLRFVVLSFLHFVDLQKKDIENACCVAKE